MFGPFRASEVRLGGLLWKIPWRMSAPQKYRHRQRLRSVDDVISTVDRGLSEMGMACKALDRLKAEVPTESEMLPRDKYFAFNARSGLRKYRKGLHKFPKWTRTTLRTSPKGF
ncbi:mitochondrial 54S ribosomal protein mL60 [Dipodascopsis tothii]|uniref:mitochondrial 54S ribosomal protein mL60 n=1 Tax=Dipodascopsis tothii TaxID=44089 RepID=UPI0034CDF63B